MAGRSKHLVSALALIASAGLAQAADMPVEAPIYSAVPVANWSGFYAGTLIGYGWSEFDLDNGAASSSADVDGSTGGAVIGYSWQSGSFVYGIEGDITLHEIRGTAPLVPGLLSATDVDTLYSAHVRGRIGYDLGRFLPYIAGGFAANESYLRTDGGAGFIGDNQWLFGWTVGAGVDFKLGDTFIGPVILRAEYLYEDFDSELFVLDTDTDASHSTHFVRIGLISYLGADPLPPVSDGFTDWSGAYGGLMAGYGAMNVETSGPGATEDFDADGALGGIYTGRNFQFGNVVVGWEGALLLSNIEGSGPQSGGVDTDFRSYIQGDLRGRIGYAFGDVLPFIAGGVIWSRSEQVDNATLNQRGRVPSEMWTVGAGVDYRLDDNWSLRAEYLYGQSFNDKSPNFAGATDQELQLHEVRFGTAYHF